MRSCACRCVRRDAERWAIAPHDSGGRPWSSIPTHDARERVGGGRAHEAKSKAKGVQRLGMKTTRDEEVETEEKVGRGRGAEERTSARPAPSRKTCTTQIARTGPATQAHLFRTALEGVRTASARLLRFRTTPRLGCASAGAGAIGQNATGERSQREERGTFAGVGSCCRSAEGCARNHLRRFSAETTER
jgi:hypothetical protein